MPGDFLGRHPAFDAAQMQQLLLLAVIERLMLNLECPL
jgi:hypothetical protein